MLRIDIVSPQDIVPINRAKTLQLVSGTLNGEGINDARISVAFVDNATIRQLNKRYLNHDEPTDVLSFPLSDGDQSALQGEVIICAEVAKEQAERRGHDIQAELALYIIHGILHLCGYDDRDSKSAAEMRKRERHYLSLMGLPDIAPAETEDGNS